MSGSTAVSNQASLRWIFLSLPFLLSYGVDTLWFMARPHSAAMSPQYLKTILKLRETLMSLCTPCTACGLMETRDESPWYQSLLLPPSDHVRSLGFPTTIGISISSAGNTCGAAVLSPPHDEDVKVRGNNLLLSGTFLDHTLCLAVGYCVLLLGWQVPSFNVLLLASLWDFAALLHSASKSWCQSVAQAQWWWISGFGSQKPHFFLECF